MTAFDLAGGRAAVFAEELRSELGLDVEPHDRLEDALGNADIIVTATWSRTPFLGSEQVRAGTHVNTMGADEPGKAELTAELLQRARFFCDLCS